MTLTAALQSSRRHILLPLRNSTRNPIQFRTSKLTPAQVSMAGEGGTTTATTSSPLRHIVLLTVEKKEDVPEVVKTLSDMAEEMIKGTHVSWISFDVSSDLGIGAGNADVGLVADFPDEENFKIYQKHSLHVAAVTHNKQFVVKRTAIQIPLPKSTL